MEEAIFPELLEVKAAEYEHIQKQPTIIFEPSSSPGSYFCSYLLKRKFYLKEEERRVGREREVEVGLGLEVSPSSTLHIILQYS